MLRTKDNVLEMLDETEYVYDYKDFEIYVDMQSGEYYAIKEDLDAYLVASDHVLKNLIKEIDEDSKNE